MNTISAPSPGFRQAFLINLGSSLGGTLVRLVVSLLIARLLMPVELGVVSIGLALLGIAHILSDFGVSTYLQREPELGQRQFSACLGVLCSATLVLSLVLLIAAGPLARQFNQPELRPLLNVLVLGFALCPFSIVMAALMMRDLAAARLAYVARLGALAHALTGLGLAALGCGAQSLAWAYVANVVVSSAACVNLCPSGLHWRPSTRAWQPVLRFGLRSLLNSLMLGLSNALPDLLLGQIGSVRLVGLLGRAQAVVNLFNRLAGGAVNFGSLRRLADLHHAQTALAPLLRRATELLIGMGWPVLALLVLFREPLLLLLYGPAWLDSAAAVAPLAAVAALGLLFNYSAVALSAIGRPHLAALPVAVTLLARLALAGLYFDGSLVSFAWILLGGTLAALPVQGWLLLRCLGLSWSSLLTSVARGLLLALCCMGTADVLRSLPLLALPAACLSWLLALRLSRHPLLEELAQLPRLRITIRK